MSSTNTKNKNKNNKQKKNQSQSNSQIEKLYDDQKRQIYQKDKTIKQLYYQVSVLKIQNHQMIDKIQKANLNAQKKIDYLNLNIQTLQDKLKSVYSLKAQLQIKYTTTDLKLKKLQKSYDQLQSQKQKQFEDYQKKILVQVQRYQNYVNQYQNSINQYNSITNQNFNLKKQIQKEVQQKKKVAADLQRQKIQALDLLKKQMIEKIQQMKKNLLTMRRQQMATNVRLTVLQNNQLVQQLQFQSKNTEKILDKNIQLQEQIKYLSKEIQIQRQLQQQIANRTNISKNIIKKLHQKNEELQQQKSQFETKLAQARSQQAYKVTRKLEQMYKSKTQDLNNKLSKTQNQLKNTKQKLSKLQNQHSISLIELYSFKKLNQDLASILISYYNQILKGSITYQEGQYVYDLTRLKSLDVSKWSHQDIQVTVKILLNLIKNKMNSKNLKIPHLDKVLIVNDEKLMNYKFPLVSCNTHSKQKRNSKSVNQLKSQDNNIEISSNSSKIPGFDFSLSKKRNLSELSKRIINSTKINKVQAISNFADKQNQILSGKIVASQTRQWGKLTNIPASQSVKRFYRKK